MISMIDNLLASIGMPLIFINIRITINFECHYWQATYHEDYYLCYHEFYQLITITNEEVHSNQPDNFEWI